MIDALLQREHTPYREIGHPLGRPFSTAPASTYTLDEVRALVARDREAASASRRCRRRSRGCRPATAGCALERRSGHARDRQAVSQGIAFDELISVAEANAFKPHVRPTPRPPRSVGLAGRGPFRRQSRLRLHRSQVGRYAHGLHRSAPAAVRDHAASARHPRAHHDRARRRHGLMPRLEATLPIRRIRVS